MSPPRVLRTRACALAARLVLVLLLAPAAAPAQVATVRPMFDLNTGPDQRARGAAFGSAVAFDGRIVFSQFTPELGRELWTTDGTAAGTRLLADLCPGRCSSDPASFHVEGTRLFFRANDGRLGAELWVLAAGAAAPSLVQDIAPGADSSTPAGFARVALRIGNTIFFRTYFVARTPATGRELYRLSTLGPPTLELDIEPGPASSEPFGLSAANGALVAFTQQDGRNRLLRVDYASGSSPPSGTTELTAPGFDGTRTTSSNSPVRTLGPNVYFIVRAGTRAELWATQGTGATTVELLEAGSIGELAVQVPLARVFFSAGSGVTTRTLHVTNGTAAGTNAIGTVRARSFVAAGNRMLFVGSSGSGADELFASDGTVAGTGLLRELVPGTGGIGAVRGVGHADGTATYAFADQLWKSDGTAPGTFRIAQLGGASADPPTAIAQLAPAAGGAALFAFGPDGAAEPHFTAGGVGEVVPLGNLVPEVGNSFPMPIGANATRVVFSARVPPDFGADLLSAARGGSAAFETVLPDASVGAPAVARVGERLVLRRSSDLAVTDGTAAGTTLVPASPDTAARACFVARNGFIYYLERIIGSGSLLDVFRFDPDAGGATRRSFLADDDGTVEFCFDSLTSIATFGTDLSLAARTSAHGTELFALDANDALRLVADIRPGPLGSMDAGWGMAALDQRLVFVADDGISGAEPYASDGTAQGTQRLADLVAGLAGSLPDDFVRVGDRVVFTASTGAAGRELHASDGTPAGTGLVVDLFPGAGSAFPTFSSIGAQRFLARDGTRALFVAPHAPGGGGCPLFETDGTATGTRCVVDLAQPGLPAFGPASDAAIAADGTIVFAAHAAGLGEEPHAVANGRLLELDGGDVAPGERGSYPQDFLVDGREVWFRADDGTTGEELWRIELPDRSRIFADGYE